MKVYLLIFISGLFLLAQSQLPTNGSAWTVTNTSFNTYLGHDYEGCWPNGTVTLFYNRSGSTFTATNWSGPACSEYNLTAQTTFFLPNNNFYGYVNSNGSVQFNYGLSNSTNMIINLWYGCIGALNCDTTATVYLSVVSSCSFSIGSVPFDTCPIASNGLYYNVSVSVYGNLSVSLGGANVLNCAGNQYIWAVLHGHNGSTCHDVATQNPDYSLLYPTAPLTGGIVLNFPVQQAENDTETFQLTVNISCSLSSFNPLDYSVSMQEFNMNSTTNLTSFGLWAWSGYACVQSKNSCPPVVVGNTVYAYNACLLNQIYNISDSFGGVLSFNLGGTPLIQNCPRDYSPRTVFGIYNTTASASGCLPASDSEPTYKVLNQTNPSQGLQISMGEGYGTEYEPVYVTINLLCAPNQTDLLVLNPPMLVGQHSSGGIDLQVNGSSPYGCPLDINATTIITA